MVRLLVAVILILAAAQLTTAEEYQLGPDSQVQDGVPKGKVTKYHWASKIFDGTERDYWVYVPAQYDGSKSACVMVFQDGGGYVNEKGQYRATVVFDNLIQKNQMPVTIGIFINPGTKTGTTGRDGKPASNRSFEYDTLSDQYARFLIDEMLPQVGKDLKLTDDPEGRAICGASSGGICAFTVAWERPDQFRKVVSHIGSFTSIAYRPNTPGSRGGDLYPTLIRKTPPKPIRVFLQDGSNDLDNAHGNWFLANQQMAAALKFAKYDFKTEWGTEGHNGKHGGAILPDTLRWLWRDYKPKQ